MREITAYICEHCEKKIYKHKSSVQSHEKRCCWNPETKSCASCDNQIYGSIETSPGYHKTTVMCAVTGANLLSATELRRNCESWSERAPF